MTSRVLRPDEWRTKLAGTELETAAPHLRPRSQVLVVEDDAGAVVACWALVPFWHVEGLWVAPEYRSRGSAARRLLAGMKRLVADLGEPVLTAADRPEIGAMLSRVGAKQIPGASYVWKG